MMKPYMRPPYWFTILLIVLLLPLFSWPWLVGGMSSASADDNDVNNVLMMIFPIYAVVSCYCAYRCYVTRRALSMILIFILILSYISAYLLIK